MKTFYKITVVLLSLLVSSTFSCKKEAAPISISQKNASLLSSNYGSVTTVITGLPSVGLAVDAAHNLYVARYQVFKITPAGIKTLLAGGSGGFGFSDGTGADAHFGYIQAVTFGPDSALYAADGYNSLIRKITPGGVVTTIAGQPGIFGYRDGPGAKSTFSYPAGITSCSEGSLYIADEFNLAIRVITPGGIVYTLAGGPGTGFFLSFGIAIDHGSVYFTAPDRHVTEKIAPDGTVSTFADVTGFSLVFDSSGNLYAADNLNNKIWKITPDGVVSTLAGSGTAGSSDGVGGNASFNSPYGLAIDGDILYVADTGNNSIRKIVIK